MKKKAKVKLKKGSIKKLSSDELSSISGGGHQSPSPMRKKKKK